MAPKFVPLVKNLGHGFLICFSIVVLILVAVMVVSLVKH